MSVHCAGWKFDQNYFTFLKELFYILPSYHDFTVFLGIFPEYGPPEYGKQIGASQWSVLSRHLVEDLLDIRKHPDLWKKYTFHFATSAIPDETFIPTFAINTDHKVNQGMGYSKYWKCSLVFNT